MQQLLSLDRQSQYQSDINQLIISFILQSLGHMGHPASHLLLLKASAMKHNDISCNITTVG